MSIAEQMVPVVTANISVTNFAKYIGVHRITVASWIKNTGQSKPRGPYWAACEKALEIVKFGLANGQFPMVAGRRDNFKDFEALMEVARLGMVVAEAQAATAAAPEPLSPARDDVSALASGTI